MKLHVFRREVLPVVFVVVGWLLLDGASRGLIAADQVVEFFPSSFIPQSVTVAVGDSVAFRRIRGNHTVTSGASDEPDAGRLFDVQLDETSPTFFLEIGVEDLAGQGFFCRNHPAQRGFVEVSSGEVTVRVAVVDNVFAPERSFIFAGDSVLWDHEFMEGVHTVTSGLSSKPEDNPGELFDVDSSCDNPRFVYRYVVPDSYPYFCRPHELMGMTGRVFALSGETPPATRCSTFRTPWRS